MIYSIVFPNKNIRSFGSDVFEFRCENQIDTYAKKSKICSLSFSFICKHLCRYWPNPIIHSYLAISYTYIVFVGIVFGGPPKKSQVKNGRDYVSTLIIYPQILKAMKNQRGDPWKLKFFC